MERMVYRSSGMCATGTDPSAYCNLLIYTGEALENLFPSNLKAIMIPLLLSSLTWRHFVTLKRKVWPVSYDVVNYMPEFKLWVHKRYFIYSLLLK